MKRPARKRLLSSAAALLVVACQPQPPAVAQIVEQLPERSLCETEASQLAETAEVFNAPVSGLNPTARLNAGRFVYLCERQGEWLGIMFPGENEKVDCSQRAADQACSLGWISQKINIKIIG